MKRIYGVGINDSGYVVKKWQTVSMTDGKRNRKLIWACPYYETWKTMLSRCYSEKMQERCPTYKGCTVCDEWLRFTKFKAWMEQQEWEGKQLDKDLLIVGNKVYSPETCVFVDRVVNAFIVDSKASRGDWPIGVSLSKSGKFKSYCCNWTTGKMDYLGLFSCPVKAHNTWLSHKLKLAKLLAAEQNDLRVANALISRYEDYKEEHTGYVI